MMQRGLALAGAFLRRDFLIGSSYRLSFALQAFEILLTVTALSFLARLVPAGPSGTFGIAPYPNYLAFVVPGFAFYSFLMMGLASFGKNLREEQLAGTLEPVFGTATHPTAAVLCSSLSTFTMSALRITVFLGLAAGLFGMPLAGINWPGALAALFLSTICFAALGMFSAGYVLVFKKGDPLTWAIGAMSWLLSGILYPVSVLPEWLRWLSKLVPMTYALDALRRSVVLGEEMGALRSDLLALVAFTALLLPASLFCFRFALEKVRRESGFGSY
jgi:ABC-2 type transport system permease protein